MSTRRWTLYDPELDELWTMPINPDSMTPVPLAFRNARRAPGPAGRLRTFVAAPERQDLEWSGVIRSQDHYEALEDWAGRDVEVVLTDHLGRVFTIVIADFAPEDRRPTPRLQWRLRYTMRAILLARGEDAPSL